MKVKGMCQVSQNGAGNAILTVETGIPPPDAQALHGKSVTVVATRQRRSTDANSLYWQVLTRIASSLNISNAYAHNLMLRRYGSHLLVNDHLIHVYVKDIETRDVNESETFHLFPTDETLVGEDGTTYRKYYVLQGSSTYSTEQMNRLINGALEEAKELGIEI